MRIPPVIVNNLEDKFESVLFLPKNSERKAEGGLRTQGYFKHTQTDKPLISVITVVFNGEQYLEQTINSVIGQTYDNVEYIIIDGGSTDGTLDIIRRYEGAIDYWVSEGDEGIYDAMNKGISVAQGRWLFFLGADDYVCSNEIFSLISSDIKSEVMLFYGNIKYSSGNFFNSSIGFKTNFINTCHHQSSFYNSYLFRFFRYNTEYKIVSDYELNYFIFNKKIKKQKVNEIIAICSDKGISHLGDTINDYFDMFKIRSNYISAALNIFFLFVGMINFYRRKINP
ncbi:MAG: glycosyltransferase [Methyloprofundus sp.]|nr:glycosyltransferase [Methyloprofundus sp.]